jgi:hypothetical protein
MVQNILRLGKVGSIFSGQEGWLAPAFLEEPSQIQSGGKPPFLT